MVMVTHTGKTSEEFCEVVSDWVETARHPTTAGATEITFQPMKELLAYLRANGFKTLIVSGGGIEFLRPWSERVYGVPPEQVIGTSIKTKYEVRDGEPVIVRLPKLNFINDKAGKPVGIHKTIGRRPIAAFGNSDGDFEMLEWTTRAPGARLGVLVHHDDAEREFAYDRKSHVGRLERALDEAGARGWTVVSMNAKTGSWSSRQHADRQPRRGNSASAVQVPTDRFAAPAFAQGETWPSPASGNARHRARCSWPSAPAVASAAVKKAAACRCTRRYSMACSGRWRS